MKLSLLVVASVLGLAAAAPVVDADTQDMMLWARTVRGRPSSASLTLQNCDCSGSKKKTTSSSSKSTNKGNQGSVRGRQSSPSLTSRSVGQLERG